MTEASPPSPTASPENSSNLGAGVLVSLCTYNERGNLTSLIEEIFQFAPQAHVLIVDDNSPDGTGLLADEIVAADSRVHVLHRPAKLGLGTALRDACRYAIEGNFTWLLNLDADFSHPPRFIPDLLACLDRTDVVVASRYVPGGGVQGWALKRQWMSRAINWYARLVLGLKTQDNSGSFRCYRVSKLREVQIERLRSKGYAIQEEMLFRCRLAGCRFEEVPFIYEERRYGETKINWREATSALSGLLLLRFRN